MPSAAPDARFYLVRPGTGISPEVLRAYLAASYRVQVEPPFALRIGEASPRLERFLVDRGLASVLGITACNPRGRMQGREVNEAALQLLRQKLESTAGRVVLEGMNEDRGGLWPSEKCFWVPDMPLAEGLVLAREFEQNAIVYSARDAVPRLAFCR